MSRRVNLSYDITESILSVKSINTIEIAHFLPREDISNESKQGYIFRFPSLLSHSSIDHKRTMKDVAYELFRSISKNCETAILIIYQTQINTYFQCLMISLAFMKRAKPLVWKIAQMRRVNIGFKEQEKLIRDVHEWIQRGSCHVSL